MVARRRATPPDVPMPGYEALAKAVADAEFLVSAGEQARKALFGVTLLKRRIAP